MPPFPQQSQACPTRCQELRAVEWQNPKGFEELKFAKDSGVVSSARGQQLRRLRSRMPGTLSNLSTHMSQECRRFCKETYPIYPRIETKRGDNLTCHCVAKISDWFLIGSEYAFSSKRGAGMSRERRRRSAALKEQRYYIL